MATSSEQECPVPKMILPLAEVTPELQEMIDRGVDARWVRTLGHSPWLKAWTDFYWPLLFRGDVDVRTKEAARLRIAKLNGCHY